MALQFKDVFFITDVVALQHSLQTDYYSYGSACAEVFSKHYDDAWTTIRSYVDSIDTYLHIPF